ncbi:MAG: hypothetical protein CMJ25_17145 [Phycisphaerae bacterium]|nr:hypothetical protein [Phycisphaerae bacterium]|tara:strand:- start:390 stop:635 length:246 start_codon:yes stop_codon:yes gene_type:complete
MKPQSSSEQAGLLRHMPDVVLGVVVFLLLGYAVLISGGSDYLARRHFEARKQSMAQGATQPDCPPCEEARRLKELQKDSGD